MRITETGLHAFDHLASDHSSIHHYFMQHRCKKQIKDLHMTLKASSKFNYQAMDLKMPVLDQNIA